MLLRPNSMSFACMTDKPTPIEYNDITGHYRQPAFQVAHPPLSVPTDISLSQYLSIQEKGVSAWEFEASYDNHRVQVHDRTEMSFLAMNQVETSVQTNLPMPKQQEVYYWEVKMFEKSPDTVVSVGVSTKPYPNTRMPGKID
ncbi:Rsp5p-dependent ubiquitination, sorting of cargo proteins at the multivesicular body [Linnemannia elongata]|nr:Rsp5p-dependent ubiquitination, sorting of cargo proteins at the multivesicular body [Linnemannia elongata]